VRRENALRFGGMRHRRHLFVCVQRRDGGGKPACGDRGGREVLAAVERSVLRQAVSDAAAARAGVTGSQCLGPCFDGPNAVCYPDAGWYASLDAGDADALAALVRGGEPSAALAAKRHPWSNDSDGDSGDGDI
jgi:(2Fe-2S) ferredoxin